MGMINGLSQCWWLSSTCGVNWDAWAAVGTFLAAFIALRIALSEQARRREEALDRALGLSTLLVPEIESWHVSIRGLVNHVGLDHAQAILESFEPEGGDVLRVPPMLRKHLHRIHELNAPARNLSMAVACAMSARQMESKVRAALRPDATDREEVLSLFLQHLGIAGGALVEASNEMNKRIFAPPVTRPWWWRLMLG
ncbi:hypothetical protein [Stenotrophomonas lactitubi]|uniref:hypothetical protein n=1 Tax=Stenotrophomonas lactitubi TaxID=2045214 RepID=UPI00320B401F